MKTAYFAGGCFWCITPIFMEINGVKTVISGYCGGEEEDPTYDQVKSQRTHHRETICVKYDPMQVSYEQLFDAFLESVDPFDAGGQFIDRGESYTLAVFYNDDSERIIAERKIQEIAAEAGKMPSVSIEQYKIFYPAEEYHQDYYLKNPEAFEKELLESGRLGESCPLRFRKRKRTEESLLKSSE